MSVTVSRRAIIGGGIAATGVGAFAGYRLLAPHLDQQAAIAGFIARQMPGLRADDEAVRAFADDAVALQLDSSVEHHFDMHVVLIANPALTRFLGASQAGVQTLFERTLLWKFLMSTDYLLRPDRAARVTYLGWSDPYRSGCSNPFARYA